MSRTLIPSPERNAAILGAVTDAGATWEQLNVVCPFRHREGLIAYLGKMVAAGQLFACTIFVGVGGKGRKPLIYFKTKELRDAFKAEQDRQRKELKRKRDRERDAAKWAAIKAARALLPPKPPSKNQFTKVNAKKASKPSVRLTALSSPKPQPKASLPILGMDSAPRVVSLWDETKSRYYVDPKSVPMFRYGSQQA